MRYESFVIQESHNPATNFTVEEKGCRTPMRAQHGGTRNKKVQWHRQSNVTLGRDPRKETALYVLSRDVLTRTAGGRRQHKQQVW